KYAGYVVGGTPHGQIPTGNVNLACVNYGDVPAATATVAGGVAYSSQPGRRSTVSGVGLGDVSEAPHGTRGMVLRRRRAIRRPGVPSSAAICAFVGSRSRLAPASQSPQRQRTACVWKGERAASFAGGTSSVSVASGSACSSCAEKTSASVPIWIRSPWWRGRL